MPPVSVPAFPINKKRPKKTKMPEAMKRAIKNVIEENRAAGGRSWKDYTKEEIIEVYGELPYWYS